MIETERCPSRARHARASHGALLAKTSDRVPLPRVEALDPLTFVVVVAITAVVSAGVFAHAERHGSRHATAWGIAAFLAAGIAVPVYFVRYWTRRKPSP